MEKNHELMVIRFEFSRGGGFLSGSPGEQTIVCEGCGSKWKIIRNSTAIIARLIECPLCELVEAKEAPA